MKRSPGDRDRDYAVAVRDVNDVFLFLQIRRNWKGEFALIWRGHERPWDDIPWNPHTTYHRDGELHHKSFDKEFGEQQLQNPDAAFTGSRQLTQTPLFPGGGRALNVPLDPTKFNGIFEIPDHQLRSRLRGEPSSSISIDLTDAQTAPQSIVQFGSQIIKQEKLYDYSMPFLWATWFELPPLQKPETEDEAQARQAEEIERAKRAIENLEARQRLLGPGTSDRLAVDDALQRIRDRVASGEGIP
jgi:hypothetical protein